MLIQLGDSFASGEGAGWRGNTSVGSGDRQGTDEAARFDSLTGKWTYRPETHVYEPNTYRESDGWWGANPCHRARHAPITYAKGAADRVVNLACSGAQSKHIWSANAGGVEQHSGLKTQLDQLRDAIFPTDDVAMVAITVGGNDISIPAYDKPGFGELVIQCMAAYVHTYFQDGYGEQWCKDEIESGAGNAISDVFYNTLKTIDQVQGALAAEGQPVGSYKLLLTGYPSITPTKWAEWSSASETGHWSDRCPVRRFDSTYINNHVVSRLNDAIQAAAEERGVGFVNMEDVFKGHRLCETDTHRGSLPAQEPQYAEWVRYLDIDVNSVNPVFEGARAKLFGSDPDEKRSKALGSQRSIAESFHPNTWGQKALGTCMKTYYNNDPINSLQRCFIGGVGPYEIPDTMVTSAIAPKTTVTDNPSGSVSIGAPLVRTLTVPANVEAGHYFQWLPNLSHQRKGQLRIEITAPNGSVIRLKDYSANDTGAWANGPWTRNYTEDPSGTWTLRIWDSDLSSYNGSLDSWSLKLF
ncbi:proprotein convertase P-domain-containing protein [Actinokineospora sp. HUAS TT18]|uniref:proprotein convertase P-domain-containing protein n=1 Tax=Actinokineospora sp. HUAS TT18 TaxID=3447451 RepID=UPI003F526F2F